MNWIKKFFKEMKRVKWVTGKKMTTILWTSMLFIILIGLCLFGVELLFTHIWTSLGVNL